MKGKTITRICRLLPATLIAAMLTACDAHIEETDMTVRPGHILCEDGSTVPYEMYDKTREKAIAVVFDTDTHDGHKGIGYAVYLWEFKEQAFADSLSIEQGKSANTDAYDGHGRIRA